MDRRGFVRTLGALGVMGIGAHLGDSLIPNAQAAQKIVVAESQGFSWAIPYLISSKDYWRPQGIEATTLAFTSGRLAFDAVQAGKAQFATTTDSVIGLAGANGVNTVIVAEFTRLSSGMVVAARTDRGIDTPAQLKGKRIATPLGTSGHYFLSRYLSLWGLSLKDVTLVNVGGGDVVSAIGKNGVDAFAWGFDSGQRAVADYPGLVRLLPDTGLEKVFVSHYVLTAPEAVVRQQPKLVEGAVRALLAAEQFYRDHHQDAVALVSARTKTSAAATQAGFDTMQVGVRLDNRLLDDLVLNGEWAINAGLAQRPKEDLRSLYRKLVYTDALKAAAPDRVTIS